MIRTDSMALLSAESANEIAALFNAFNAMVGINGCRVVHGQSNLVIQLGDGEQGAKSPVPEVPMIEPGDSDTYFSASKLNVLIAAYNKIVSSVGDGVIGVRLLTAGAVVVVAWTGFLIGGGSSWGKIQPVVKGDIRGAVSPEIYEPISTLAVALKKMRGENCDVYLSDGRFVVDLINSTRGGEEGNMTDGGDGPDDGLPEFWDFPTLPPTIGAPAGWTTGNMIAGFWVDKHKCGIRSWRYWDNTTEDDGERYLRWEVTLSGIFVYPEPFLGAGLPYYSSEAGPWYYDGGFGTFTPTFPAVQYSFLRGGVAGGFIPGESQQGGVCWVNGNRYSLTSTRGRASVLSYRNEIQMAGAPTLLAANVVPPTTTTGFISNVADGVSQTGLVYNRDTCQLNGVLKNRYTSAQLYEDAGTLMATAATSNNFLLFCEFEQPTGPSNSNNTPSATLVPYTHYPTIQYWDPIPIDHGSYSDEKQNIVGAGQIGSKTLNKQFGGTQVLCYHFARKARGGGTFANPTGKIIHVEMQRCQFGTKPGPTTWYVHQFTVPIGYGTTTYPQQRLPSNGVYVGTTAVVSSGTHIDLVPNEQTGYYIVNRTASPPAPETPEVDTGQSLQPTVVKVGADLKYTWNHSEPYLTFEIYRNTTNNSATATLVATVAAQEPVGVDTLGDAFFTAFTFTYTDTGPFVGGTTYYYWHKAYFDASRKSGFSIVKSITY
jgi:hypothetical protein